MFSSLPSIRWSPSLLVLGTLACSGTAETPDTGSPDAATDTTLQETGEDVENEDATLVEAGPDSNPGLEFGRCCGKPQDCASLRCAALGDGPSFCSQSCQVYPDDCPIGFYCEGSVDACIPPSGESTCIP